MLARLSRYVLAVLAAVGVFRADIADAQTLVLPTTPLTTPLQLTSLEWLVADSDVVVRGVVVDVVAAEQGNWNIVTLSVLETLKGPRVERLKFAAHKLPHHLMLASKSGATIDKGNALLAEAKHSKRELLWILKSQASGVAGETPDREKVLARHKIDLHAPFLPGRPGEPTLPVVPLGPGPFGERQPPPAFLTIDLRVVKTSDEIVKAIRTAIAEPGDTCPCEGSPPAYSLALPQEIAQRTGFSRANNLLLVPVDHRLEAFARRLIQSPADFSSTKAPNKSDPKSPDKVTPDALSKQIIHSSSIHALRLEGVKALRQFPSEKNLAIVRSWLDDPMSTDSFKIQSPTLVPPLPKIKATVQKATLPTELAQVPEVHFQQPLTKAMKTDLAQLHTAVTIDSVHLLNQKKTDAFIETLMHKRPDLAGLSFAMGDSCRMKPEAGRQFVAALATFRKSESQSERPLEQRPLEEVRKLMQHYKAQAVDSSASVASLMQVLGHENAAIRLGLVEYLDGLAHVDATRALARLAIFSAESDIRSAAVKALKTRRGHDYTAVLLGGLKYPWPAVAERSSEAIVKLGRRDLVPHLIDVLETPDPRAPQTQEINGKKVAVVRELVRINHHHNCLLCHAPAPRENTSKEALAKLEGLTAQVPVPSESMVAYYRPSVPDILVRVDVTYLRQDFSLKLAVANADPWPELQRYDFLVRTREVSAQEALAYQGLLQSSQTEAVSPYRRAALSALRELTGVDTDLTAAAWRKATRTPR